MKAVCTFPKQNTVLCGHIAELVLLDCALNKSPGRSRIQQFVFIHFPKQKTKKRILVPLLTVCLQLAAF